MKRCRIITLLCVTIVLLNLLAWVKNDHYRSTPYQFIGNVTKSLLVRSRQTTAPLPTTPSPNIGIPLVYYDNDLIVVKAWNANQTRNCSQLVPKRIHQTWKNEQLPADFVAYVRSWVEKNPDWEYWFWTDALADRFIAERFPQYVNMYRNYKHGIMRADAMRYFILYEFGGVYADLDMVALRSLDDLRPMHTALIPQDHGTHRYVFWRRARIPLNALMMFVPRHPFMKAVIESLPSRDRLTKRDNWQNKTGPMMLEIILNQYSKSNGQRTDDVCRSVYIADDSRFVPLFDERSLRGLFRRLCRVRMQQPDPRIKWCDYLRASNFKNHPVPATAYTKHLFVHTYGGWRQRATKDIDEVVPKRVNVSEIIDDL